jgi:hypothetical protein
MEVRCNGNRGVIIRHFDISRNIFGFAVTHVTPSGGIPIDKSARRQEAFHSNS